MNNTTLVAESAANFRYVGVTIGIIDIILGTLGNLLTILVFSQNTALHYSFNYFIVNLSIIDLLTAGLMMPFNIAGYVQMDWPLGGAGSMSASLQAYFYFCCGYTSIVCLVIITVNRFISIRFPQLYLKLFNKQRMTMIIVTSWLIAPAFLLPVVIAKTEDGNPVLGWQASQFLCTFINMPFPWRTYMQVLRVIFQFLPMLIMVVLYFVMFWKFRHHDITSASSLPWEGGKKANEHESHVLLTMGTEVQLNNEEEIIARKMKSKETREKEKRLLLVSVVVCVVFALLFLPSLVINLLPSSSVQDVRFHMAASNITWLNSCVNPFIYVIVNPKFRTEYKIFLRYLWLKMTCKL